MRSKKEEGGEEEDNAALMKVEYGQILYINFNKGYTLSVSQLSFFEIFVHLSDYYVLVF